jgi:predicted permease
MLALLGGLGGVAVAGWIAGLLRRFQPPVPMAGRFSLDVHPDGRVLLFALALSVASGVLFGLAPALPSVRPELVPALKDATPGAGRRSRLRDVFVVGQVALSLLLLLSAGLFVRALGRAVRVDPGFEPAGVIVGSLDLSPYGYTPESGAEFYRRLLERLRATPGVESASLAQLVPLTGTRMELGVRLPGRKEPESVIFNTVGEDYFRTMRMSLLQGRALGPQDRAGAPMALVVNEAFARQHFPGQDPLGQHVEMLEPGGQGSVAEVVGVVADSRWTGLQEPPTPVAYQALAQHYTPRVTVHVRTIGSPAGFAPTLRRVVQEMDAAVPVSRPEPLEQVVAIALLPQRLGAVVAGSFGLIGLLLAGIGLSGVMAFAVTQRTREIGIRTALGARAGDTLRLVLRHALGLVGAGVLIGLAAGMGATRLLSGLLFGVSPTDPVAFSGVIVLLLAVALVASLVPARRATRVDPMVALRAE